MQLALKRFFDLMPNLKASDFDYVIFDMPPLEQIKRFYLTAEAISAENLDRQFDRLLERQRQLISAYFTGTAVQEDPR